jgi:hypothetical protein
MPHNVAVDAIRRDPAEARQASFADAAPAFTRWSELDDAIGERADIIAHRCVDSVDYGDGCRMSAYSVIV